MVVSPRVLPDVVGSVRLFQFVGLVRTESVSYGTVGFLFGLGHTVSLFGFSSGVRWLFAGDFVAALLAVSRLHIAPEQV